MLNAGKYTEQFQELFTEVKQYLSLEKKYLAMDAADKLTVLLSTVAIASVCLILGAMTLFFGAFALAYWLGQLTNSLPLGFLIITVAIALLLIIFYNRRSGLIIQPLARLMTQLFVEKKEKELS